MKKVILIFGMALCYLLSFSQETGTFTDPRDGKVYKTVKIGNEIWMAENLAFLPTVSPSSQGSETSPIYYVYDYQGTDVTTAKETPNFILYGVLYNWEAAKSACPSGWHLPALVGEIVLTNDLIEYLRDNGYGYGQYKDVGKSMASTSVWTSYSVAGTVGNDQVSNNKSGFSALPGGFRYSDGSFKDKLNNAGFWTSKPDVFNPGSHANGLVLYYANQGLIQYKTFKSAGLSVRCIKDK
jgi:uncharacterized protein (TIGR02145 family)